MINTVYYFSGTGNSLCVAKYLTSKLNNVELIPVVSKFQLKEKIQNDSEVIGFIFPNFCLSIPIPIKIFLTKIDLSSTKYLYGICTRGGTESEAFSYINKLLKKQNKQLNAKMLITMPWNHPLGKSNIISKNTIQNNVNLEKIMHSKIDHLVEIITARENYEIIDNEASYKLPSFVKLFLLSKRVNYELHRFMYQRLIKFYTDNKCNGCGVCENVCQSKKIKIYNNKPEWNKKIACYGCFACINYCPNISIQIKSNFPVISYTTKNERYHHPEITVSEIENQKKLHLTTAST